MQLPRNYGQSNRPLKLISLRQRKKEYPLFSSAKSTPTGASRARSSLCFLAAYNQEIKVGAAQRIFLRLLFSPVPAAAQPSRGDTRGGNRRRGKIISEDRVKRDKERKDGSIIHLGSRGLFLSLPPGSVRAWRRDTTRTRSTYTKKSRCCDAPIAENPLRDFRSSERASLLHCLLLRLSPALPFALFFLTPRALSCSPSFLSAYFHRDLFTSLKFSEQKIPGARGYFSFKARVAFAFTLIYYSLMSTKLRNIYYQTTDARWTIVYKEN